MSVSEIATTTINKVVRVGTIAAGGSGGQVSVYAHIEFKDGRLSISGVEGPKSNGDAWGSCGQIIIGFKEYDPRGYKSLSDITPAPSWDAAMLRRFFDVWDRWHLKDMQAGCEHQRKIDTGRMVEVVKYKLKQEALRMRTATIAAAAKAALAGEQFTPTPTARALAEIEHWYGTISTPPDADSPLSGCYEVDKRETKAIGWVTQNEHPDGMLSRACGECGYKYGSSWLREEVPADVIEWLSGLPDADRKPAWV